jgi:hypothetical protein
MSFTLEELTQEMQVCYRNWKAFAYWVAADYMKKRMVGGFTDETLRADTAAVYAFYKSDKTFQVEDKDQIKKRIGRSPDYWESFVYACWSYYSGKMLEDFDMMYTSAQHKGVPA